MMSSILTFHRIHPDRDPLWDPIDPLLFRKLLRYVQKNYTVLPLEELCLSAPRTPKRPLAITFDDGYRDYIDYALPILDEFKFHSSMYVVTDCVEKGVPTWTYVFDYLFTNTSRLKIDEADYGPFCKNFRVFQWAGKHEQMAYAGRFKQFLKKAPAAVRKIVLQHLAASFTDVEVPQGLMMTWDDLRSLKGANLALGSHTVTHPPLATIEDKTELQNEIAGSRQVMAEKLGEAPLTISYPVGSYNQTVKDLSQAAGYQIGLAVDHILYNNQSRHLFAVPRIELYNDSYFRNVLRIRGIEAFVKSIVR